MSPYSTDILDPRLIMMDRQTGQCKPECHHTVPTSWIHAWLWLIVGRVSVNLNVIVQYRHPGSTPDYDGSSYGSVLTWMSPYSTDILDPRLIVMDRPPGQCKPECQRTEPTSCIHAWIWLIVGRITVNLNVTIQYRHPGSTPDYDWSSDGSV